jgi:DNA-binding MarR family transcriptional regulator
MGTSEHDPELQPLADIDPIIHAPARLMILTYLYVVESVDYVFLMRMTRLTWGNLSNHLTKLEEAGYVTIQREFRGKKPHSMIHLTDRGREAFRTYKENMQQVFDSLPDDRQQAGKH